MKGLGGALLLVGGVAQGIALFVRDDYYGSSVWRALTDSPEGAIGTSLYPAAAILTMAAGILCLTIGAEVFASYGAGVASLAVFVWGPMVLAPIVSNHGFDIHVPSYGIVGVVGAALGLVGGILGWMGPSATSHANVGASLTAAAGWYPDPAGRGQRWWDGTAWTTHTQP